MFFLSKVFGCCIKQGQTNIVYRIKHIVYNNGYIHCTFSIDLRTVEYRKRCNHEQKISSSGRHVLYKFAPSTLSLNIFYFDLKTMRGGYLKDEKGPFRN